MITTVCAILISGALAAPAFAQEGQPGQAAVSPAAAAPAEKPAAPVKIKTPKKKTAEKPQAKEPAAEAAAPAVSQAPALPAPAAEAPPLIEAPTVAPAAPAPVSEAVKPAAPAPSPCPHCFQPLLAGYKGIIEDLNPWMEGMDAQAAALDGKLSAIQRQINEKESAIENARRGTDKKAMKEAVKSLTKERKLLLKEYTTASEEKDAFYKKFSKEVEKRTEGYNKIVESKLNETLSAASQ